MDDDFEAAIGIVVGMFLMIFGGVAVLAWFAP